MLCSGCSGDEAIELLHADCKLCGKLICRQNGLTKRIAELRVKRIMQHQIIQHFLCLTAADRQSGAAYRLRYLRIPRRLCQQVCNRPVQLHRDLLHVVLRHRSRNGGADNILRCKGFTAKILPERHDLLIVVTEGRACQDELQMPRRFTVRKRSLQPAQERSDLDALRAVIGVCFV